MVAIPRGRVRHDLAAEEGVIVMRKASFVYAHAGRQFSIAILALLGIVLGHIRVLFSG